MMSMLFISLVHKSSADRSFLDGSKSIFWLSSFVKKFALLRVRCKGGLFIFAYISSLERKKKLKRGNVFVDFKLKY